MIRKIVVVALEATLYFLVGIFLCLLHYVLSGQNEDFATRWSGACTGWTKGLAAKSVAGNLLLWWAYSAISVTILRLHPVVDKIPESRWTIRITGAFIIACGGTHLLEAYSTFNPVYVFSTNFLLVTAAISDVAIFFVAAGLIRVFARVTKARARLAEYDKKYGSN